MLGNTCLNLGSLFHSLTYSVLLQQSVTPNNVRFVYGFERTQDSSKTSQIFLENFELVKKQQHDWKKLSELRSKRVDIHL